MSVRFLMALLWFVSCCVTALSAEKLAFALYTQDSKLGPAISPEFFGHDLEFTRHDLFEGLSSELIGNRKFAVPAPCPTQGYGCWPRAVQTLVAQGIGGAPRWRAIGNAALAPPWWGPKNSALVTGDLGHSVRCAAGAAACGVEQSRTLDGFDAGMSFGSAIALHSNSSYGLRLVLRGNTTVMTIGHGPHATGIRLEAAQATGHR